MDLDISGKTALVTGASRGIGLAIAQALAAEGVRVVGAARTVTPELEAVAAAAVPVDLSTRAGARAVVEQALAAVGGIDFLVNNVGAGDPEAFSPGGFLDTDDEQWERVFDLNLFSAMWTTKAALPSILERGGAIVNISSINARIPAGAPVGYAEAKAALNLFGKRLSEELAPRGVRVNTVSRAPRSAPSGPTRPVSAARWLRSLGWTTASCSQVCRGSSASPRDASPSRRRWRTWSPSCCPAVRPISTVRTMSSTAARSRPPEGTDSGPDRHGCAPSPGLSEGAPGVRRGGRVRRP